MVTRTNERQRSGAARGSKWSRCVAGRRAREFTRRRDPDRVCAFRAVGAGVRDRSRHRHRLEPGVTRRQRHRIRHAAAAPGALCDGDARVYLIVVKVTDLSNNTGFSCCTMAVPPLGISGRPAGDAADHGGAELVRRSGMPPPNYFAIGDGPVIGPKQ